MDSITVAKQRHGAYTGCRGEFTLQPATRDVDDWRCNDCGTVIPVSGMESSVSTTPGQAGPFAYWLASDSGILKHQYGRTTVKTEEKPAVDFLENGDSITLNAPGSWSSGPSVTGMVDIRGKEAEVTITVNGKELTKVQEFKVQEFKIKEHPKPPRRNFTTAELSYAVAWLAKEYPGESVIWECPGGCYRIESTPGAADARVIKSLCIHCLFPDLGCC